MFHSSRTTIKELKKRYLNILKKCLLANLMAFSFALPVMADIFLYSGSENIINNSFNFSRKVISEDTEIDLSGKNLVYTNVVSSIDGGVFYVNSGKRLMFKNTSDLNNILLFKDNTLSINNWANGGVFYNAGIISFDEDVSFVKNEAYSGGIDVYGGVFRNIGASALLTFSGNILFKQNLAAAKAIPNSNGAIKQGDAYAGAISNSGGVLFNKNSKTVFAGNKVYADSINAYGGAIFNTGYILFDKGSSVIFVRNEATGNGGAIFNMHTSNTNKYLTFAGDFYFVDNRIGMNDNIKNNDIYNRGYLNFSHGINDNGQLHIGTLDGGIYNIGEINKNGVGLLILGDQMDNGYDASSSATFVQTAGITISSSHNLLLAETHTINGGELKTHGAEIAYKATLGETGTLTHLGSSADTPTEIKGVTFNGTGLNLTLGTYTKAEQEKEIALVGDRLVEYVDDKGTEDTSDDELVSYQVTDKLFTIDALENDQKAKFVLKENLAGMDGNTLTIDNAELDVIAGLKVAGTVIAKDMTLSKGTPLVSFTEVTVATDGVLDIGTREMNVDSMTLQDGATLKIALNSLKEHGKVNGLLTGTSTSQLALNLATDVEMGTYQLFDQDNDIALEENLFFNIKDLENGSYEVSKKTTKDLMKDFGLTTTQGAVTMALMEGDSSNEAFSKMQSEMLEALQSTDKAQVQKAKKALKAVGKSEQPSSQSIAAGHFNELTRVISQMAMEKEAEVGRSGGEEEARAKVYIKGLYDKTKSTMGDGFKARSQGAVLGVQSEVTDSLTLGVGYATSQTTAKEDLRRTEVDTNTGFISVHYQPNAWWLSGLATYSSGQYDEQKQILSSVSKANYDVDSWGVQVMTGYDIKLENAIITPEVGMRYLSVKQEGYTDTLGTTVEATSSDYLTAIAGVKTAWDLGKIRPTVGINVGYDVISDDVSALNTLANGSSYTVNAEALDRLSVGISTGVEAKLNDRTTLKLEYNGSFRKEYTDHSGMLKLELRF